MPSPSTPTLLPLRPVPALRLAVETDAAACLDALIAQALQWQASDIHFEPFEHGLRVRCRVDGMLDAQYIGCNPWTADVILQTHMLLKLDAQAEVH